MEHLRLQIFWAPRGLISSSSVDTGFVKINLVTFVGAVFKSPSEL